MSVRRRQGVIEQADLSRLARLSAELEEERTRICRVDYARAEQGCDLLASRLVAAFGREVCGFDFRPIPRGGLFILGMLSYALDLTPDRLEGPLAPSAPLVLVDDCALTGARFAQALDATCAQEVVFAHLYSPLALRQRIVEAEPRVLACVAVWDLEDRSRGLAPAELRSRERRWRGRLGGERYVLCQTDPVHFPWGAAERPFWNPVTREVENGWSLGPPGHDLRSRGRLGLPPGSPVRPRWSVSPDVVYREAEGDHWLCNTATGEVVSLHETAVEIWCRLARHGDPATASVEVAGEHGLEVESVRADVDEVAHVLAERGFLIEIEDDGL